MINKVHITNISTADLNQQIQQFAIKVHIHVQDLMAAQFMLAVDNCNSRRMKVILSLSF